MTLGKNQEASYRILRASGLSRSLELPCNFANRFEMLVNTG